MRFADEGEMITRKWMGTQSIDLDRETCLAYQYLPFPDPAQHFIRFLTSLPFLFLFYPFPGREISEISDIIQGLVLGQNCLFLGSWDTAGYREFRVRRRGPRQPTGVIYFHQLRSDHPTKLALLGAPFDF